MRRFPSFLSFRRFILAAFALILAGGFVLGCASLDEKQGGRIFNPTDRNWGNSAAMLEKMDEHFHAFESKITGKTTKLHIVVSGDSSAISTPVLLYLHGARWNVANSAWRMERMRELGFVVVAVDYRGFGKSDRETPSESKAYEDAEQAWAWIAKRYPHRDRYIFGHSLGGAIGVELAQRVSDEKGLILEGTFTSIPDVVATMKWGWLPVGPFITQRFDSEKKIAKVGSPVLVVHGSEDGVINPALGLKLFEAAVSPKRFELVRGGSHHNTNGLGQAQYRVAMRELFGL